MNICQSCGAERSDQDRFCRSCGVSVATSVADLDDTRRFNPAASATVGDRVGMVFKLATTAGTTAGSYSQTVYYTLTANY